ncbi:MAG TPA: DUF1415 domain-containing protein [Noviherbaspirillum sp.]|nr:DUF1415 domain-containing protein [Noviherbaspirillum sp.]
MNTTDDLSAVIDATRRWVEHAVIGLNLCPFAKSVQARGQVRYVVSAARSPLELHGELVSELQLLRDANPDEVDTTLLIHPFVLTDFLDYNDFLDVVDATVEELGLTGQIQVASFHPQYQFAGSAPDDVENGTNRSPYPTLHLLRETSIDRAVAAIPDASDIFSKNIATMQWLGHEGWNKLRTSFHQAPEPHGSNEKQKN